MLINCLVLPAPVSINLTNSSSQPPSHLSLRLGEWTCFLCRPMRLVLTDNTSKNATCACVQSAHACRTVLGDNIHLFTLASGIYFFLHKTSSSCSSRIHRRCHDRALWQSYSPIYCVVTAFVLTLRIDNVSYSDIKLLSLCIVSVRTAVRFYMVMVFW